MDIKGLHLKVVDFISNGTAKTKLAVLAFLCCGNFAKALNYFCNPLLVNNEHKFGCPVIYMDIFLQCCFVHFQQYIIDLKQLRSLIRTLYLPPANEVWGMVIFSQECAIPSVYRGSAFRGRGLDVGESASGGSTSGGGLSPVGSPFGWSVSRGF